MGGSPKAEFFGKRSHGLVFLVGIWRFSSGELVIRRPLLVSDPMVRRGPNGGRGHFIGISEARIRGEWHGDWHRF